MKALIETCNNEHNLVTLEGSIRNFLNNHNDNYTYSIKFYKRLYGSYIEVASVYFSSPCTVELRNGLTITEQKSFLHFVEDHLTESVYGTPFNVRFVSNC